MLKRFSVLFFVAMAMFSQAAFAVQNYDPAHPVHVKQYTKKTGTVVHEHYRAKPSKKNYIGYIN